jgi:hypothetical protein
MSGFCALSPEQWALLSDQVIARYGVEVVNKNFSLDSIIEEDRRFLIREFRHEYQRRRRLPEKGNEK